MTVRKKKNTVSLYESHEDADHELHQEQKIFEWRNSSADVRTREFIQSCSRSKTTFIDSDFLRHAEGWIEILLQYEDSFCGEHATNNWDTHCRNFLREVLDKENNPVLEKVVNDGSAQGNFTYTEDHEPVNNFSWMLWLFGLADKPTFEATEEKTLKITLIGQGKLVFTQLKNQREIKKLVLVENNDIDYNLTMNNIDNKGGTIGSVGASGSSKTIQRIEQKKDFSFMELLKSLKIVIPAIIILILLIAYFTGNLTLSDIQKFIPKL